MNDHQVISCLRVESLEISFAGFGLLAHFFHLFLLCLICLLVEYSNTKSLFLLNRYLFEGYKKDYCSCFFEEIYLIQKIYDSNPFKIAILSMEKSIFFFFHSSLLLPIFVKLFILHCYLPFYLPNSFFLFSYLHSGYSRFMLNLLSIHIYLYLFYWLRFNFQIVIIIIFFSKGVFLEKTKFANCLAKIHFVFDLGINSSNCQFHYLKIFDSVELFNTNQRFTND